MFQIVHHQGVAGLVDGHNFAFRRADDFIFVFRSGYNSFHRVLKLLLANHPQIAASRQNSRLIDQILQVGAYKAGRQPGQVDQRDISGQRLALNVYFENGFPIMHVGPI